ncbi:hypothetical protein AB8806_23335 (plasmid) [Ralstonia syzygii subsp. celebesensis]
MTMTSAPVGLKTDAPKIDHPFPSDWIGAQDSAARRSSSACRKNLRPAGTLRA